MTDREPSKASESIQQSLANRETVAPSGLEDSTPTGSGPFTALPSQFGKYHVTKLLGRGAMGSVYLAHDPDLGKEVALKVPKFSGDEDPVLLERFRREARAAGDLNHANICGVYEVGQIGTTHFIAMEYIDGRPLSDYISPDLPMRKIAILIRRLALALAQAHDRGIVHRDLKPANIMVNQQGEPVIMDFGLACRLDPGNDVRATQSGMIVGSPAYMSPEQARADRDSIGPRTDIYGLGVLFFELLTGSLPFRGPMLSVLGQLATQPPPKPSSLRTDVDPRLESLCLKMLEKKLQNRPASMAEVAQSLTEWLKPATTKSEPAIALVEEPVALVPTKPALPRAEKADGIEAHKQRVTDLLDRHQYGPAIELLEKITNLRDSKFEKLVAWAKPKLKEVRATEQKLREASAPICETAEQHLKKHDYTGAVQVLEQVPSAYRSAELRNLLVKSTELRDECDHLFQDIDEAIQRGDADVLPSLVKRLLKLKPGSKAVKQLAEDLKKFGAKKTIARRKGQSRLIESNERLFEPKQIVAVVLGLAALFATVYFAVVAYVQTPHGTLVVDVQGEGLQAVVQDGHVVIRDGKQEFRIKTSDKKTLTVEHRGTTITGSSREITLKRGETRTVTVKLIDGKIKLTDNSEEFTFPVSQDTDDPQPPITPTGQKRLSDEVVGEVHRLQGHTNGGLMVAFSPDGKRIASGGDGVTVWDVLTGAKVSELPDRGTRAIGFSRDGMQLVLGGMGRILRVVDVESQKEMSRFDRHQQIVHSAACSPITDLVASGDGGFWDDKVQQWASATGPKLRLWNPLTGQQVAELAGHTGPIHAVVFSRDGQMIATASIDQTVLLWSVPEQRLIARFDGHQSPVMSVGFSTADTLALEGSPSTNEATIVSGDAAGEVRLWSIREGRSIRAFQASNQSVHQLSVTRDGQFLTACAADKQVKLWKPFGQESTYQFSGNDEAVYSVASSPDGRLAATAGGLYGTGRDFSVRIHRLPPIATDLAKPILNSDGWVSLFNGKDLTGWTWSKAATSNTNPWLIEGDTLVGNSGDVSDVEGRGFLLSRGQYADFDLKLEFRAFPQGTTPFVDAGVFVRAPASSASSTFNEAIQVNLRGRNDGVVDPLELVSGAIASKVKPALANYYIPGEWNSVLISCLGSKITTRVNGKLTAEVDVDELLKAEPNRKGMLPDLERRTGYIVLQTWFGRVEYRNIRIKEMGAAAAPQTTLGTVMDLLPLVDLKQDVHAGVWKAESNRELSVANGGTLTRPIMSFPVSLTENYRLSVDFTVDEGSPNIKLSLPVGSRAVTASMAERDAGQVDGLSFINGVNLAANTNPTRTPGRLVRNTRHRLRAEVFLKGDQAQVVLTLDDQRLVDWSGPQSALSQDSFWSTPNPKLVGLGGYNCRAVFHQATLASAPGKVNLLPGRSRETNRKEPTPIVPPVTPPAPVPTGPRLAPARPGGTAAKDQPSPELLLVGFDTTVGTVKIPLIGGGGRMGDFTVITSLKPLYADQNGKLVEGTKVYGKALGEKKRLLEMPRAVGAVKIRGANYVDSIEVELMRTNGNRLITTDVKAEKAGGSGGGNQPTLGGDGKQYVGCIVYSDSQGITGLGLIPK